jgi:hypothetical protein
MTEPATPKSASTHLLPSTLSYSAPRQFYLSQPIAPATFPSTTHRRKRKAEIALFVEKRTRPKVSLTAGEPIGEPTGITDAPDAHLPREEQGKERKLKRPSGRINLAIRSNGASHEEKRSEAPLEPPPELVEEMEAWVEQTELAERSVAQPTFKTNPIEPVIRSSDEDLDMNDADGEGDYVYDTYIRHPVSPNATLDPAALVGHLVISEEDQELWQTYIDDDADENEFETDDEDSNGSSFLIHCKH